MIKCPPPVFTLRPWRPWREASSASFRFSRIHSVQRFFAVFGGAGEGLHDSPGHPGGMPEGSRGLRSALRDDTPRCVRSHSCIPAGCQILRTEHRFWHPAGVRLLTMPEPGVSLRSTPGYLLASLQDVFGRLLRLASIPPKTAKNQFKSECLTQSPPRTQRNWKETHGKQAARR